MIGIIDGTGGQSTEFIQAICDILELPHVTIKHNEIKENSYILNLHPSSMAYNMVSTSKMYVHFKVKLLIKSRVFQDKKVISLFTL